MILLKQVPFLTLAIFAFSSCPTTLADGDYCYSDADGCGPGTPAWPPLCHNGQAQSPISLPASGNPTGAYSLRIMNVYRGDFFRMQNNGHSLYIDFIGESGENEGPTSQPITFPDPLAVDQPTNTRQYKFLAAHFHWGKVDGSGSEHCFGANCAAMEVHFVHYWTKFNSSHEALESDDENALAVIGGLINATAPAAGPPGFAPPPGLGPQPGQPQALGPVVKNMGLVEKPGGGFIRVEEALDLTELLGASQPIQMYSYKGSLTTPKCQEQVNWFVRNRAAGIPQAHLDAFRTCLKDAHSKTLVNNYRPIQEANDRKIVFSNVFPTSV